MSATITIFYEATGNLGPILTDSSLEVLVDRLNEGESYIEGAYNNLTHMVDLATLTVIEKPATVEGLRIELWDKVKRKRRNVELNGCNTPLGVMDTDETSQRKINGAVTMAILAMIASQPYLEAWTMKDNSVVDHDGPAMIAAGVAVGTHVANCHAVATALRVEIEAATTIAELEAIDIDAADWP